MRQSLVALKAVRVPIAPKPVNLYSIPDLSTISHKELPNNGFGISNYAISKSKFNHWPVYLKIQNTKITTEIKRVQGDVQQLKADLLRLNPSLKISVNQNIGYVNIKGDVVDEIKQYFNEHL